jgi:branched-chain amino acid aminotransferase
MADKEGFIWFDGQLTSWRDSQVHVLTHSLHYGLAVFEGIRAYKTDKGAAIFRLQDHSKRLFDSAKILGMKIPYDIETINKATCASVKANRLESAYIRPICFYGAEGMGLRANNLQVHTAIAAWYWGSYLGEEGMEKGIRIRTSSYTRHHVNVTMCRAKATGNYMNSILALQEATRCGYDEALLLDAQGYVTEGSGENFFLVRDGVFYTPTLTSALNGITRATVIHLAQEMGYQVVEKFITRDEVYIADEAFFTGTAAEVTPIRELDDRQIGTGSRGKITEQLQSRYFDIVHGRASAYDHWLSYV